MRSVDAEREKRKNGCVKCHIAMEQGVDGCRSPDDKILLPLCARRALRRVAKLEQRKTYREGFQAAVSLAVQDPNFFAILVSARAAKVKTAAARIQRRTK